jgi:hypothetical protein
LNAVYIVFPTEILRDTDEEVYESLQLMMPSVNIIRCIGTEEAVKRCQPEDLLLLDEADKLLLDNESELPQKCLGIVAVSATSFSKDGGPEDEYLKKYLKFDVLDSGMEGDINQEDLESVSNPSNFFVKELRQRALLIWCKKEDVGLLTKLAEAIFIVKLDCRDMAVIRHLTSKDCLIVTDEDLMRGVDY